ncbi:MAG: DUF1566 domain-containing protein [Flavobacteriales bacterium]|nr:DUF1566 domain-containing protein [Flavobacteriales bacterium]
MKSFFTLSAVIFMAICLSSDLQGQSSVLGKPYKIRNLEIAQYDFPNTMDWKTAKKACSKLGKRWRLPNIKELKMMNENRKKLGNFKKDWYWASEKVNPHFSKKGFLVFNFQDTSEWWSEVEIKWNVRAVKGAY